MPKNLSRARAAMSTYQDMLKKKNEGSIMRPGRGLDYPSKLGRLGVHRRDRERRELEAATASLRAAGPSRKTSGRAGTGGRAEGIPRRAREGGGVDARRAGVRFFFGEEKIFKEPYGARGADCPARREEREESTVCRLVVL